ncbi:MBL fold metallo-hydrolase [Thomasclavelia spiroformis]|uniref:MBL fold metallo-hydrolase n=1 Tax=Thomasclavelia spiroformis TaxID=29348 RepID=UPI003207C2B1
MEIKPLASSSKGNAYLITDGMTTILVECGIPFRELKIRTKFIVPSKIDACLVSHLHNDHAKSLKDLLNAGVDCYALKETFEAKGIKDHHRANIIEFNKMFTIGTLTVVPLEMKHDVPCIGFYIHSTVTNEYLLFATDTYLIKAKPAMVNYIMIEANYDVNLVEDDAQRERLIKSHMSIETTVQYLKSIDLQNVKKIYLMHLSSRHSNEEDFKKRVQAATGKQVVVCAE